MCLLPTKGHTVWFQCCLVLSTIQCLCYLDIFRPIRDFKKVATWGQKIQRILSIIENVILNLYINQRQSIAELDVGFLNPSGLGKSFIYSINGIQNKKRCQKVGHLLWLLPRKLLSVNTSLLYILSYRCCWCSHLQANWGTRRTNLWHKSKFHVFRVLPRKMKFWRGQTHL